MTRIAVTKTAVKQSVIGFALALALSMIAAPAIAASHTDADIDKASRTVVFGLPGDSGKSQALKILVERGNMDVAASLILAIRYRGADAATMAALNKITGQSLTGWHDAMLWQELNDNVKPHSSFRKIKTEMFARIDRNFNRFLGGDRSKPENMKIRLEEITWGGVVVDGIPSLDNPKLIDAAKANYLIDSDLVFGVKINGDVRAYPLRIMGWHEMFNETIGGVPVALAYCTLCGSGILFETKIEGRDKPLIFGSSGFLYRSNKLMFDRETDSLWNQFTGEPVTGPLVNSGIKLKILPVTITTWANWKKSNPATKVLSLGTGYNRDYGSGVVYREYFGSPGLMFPVLLTKNSKLAAKDYVFGIREVAAAKAWPVKAFKGMKVINDKVGSLKVVLVGDAESRTVRAYKRADNEFIKSSVVDHISANGQDWKITEEYLLSPDQTKLPRVPGHISYWFAWDGYLGVKSELYDG